MQQEKHAFNHWFTSIGIRLSILILASTAYVAMTYFLWISDWGWAGHRRLVEENKKLNGTPAQYLCDQCNKRRATRSAYYGAGITVYFCDRCDPPTTITKFAQSPWNREVDTKPDPITLGFFLIIQTIACIAYLRFAGAWWIRNDFPFHAIFKGASFAIALAGGLTLVSRGFGFSWLVSISLATALNGCIASYVSEIFMRFDFTEFFSYPDRAVPAVGQLVSPKAFDNAAGSIYFVATMKTAVQRWGNSLALRIPKAYATEAQIHHGTEVELSLKSGALLVRVARPKRHRLADLLKGITSANQHREVSTGKPVGREAW